MIQSVIDNVINNIKNYDEIKLSAKIDENIFRLPISYIEKKYEISDIIKSDLELVDDISKSSAYNYLLDCKSKYGKLLVKQWSEYYTNDINYLKDTINLIKNFRPINKGRIYENTERIDNICIELRNETGFYEKYKYIDNKFFHGLNNSGLFLQALTIYNLSSPVLSLMFPILILIVPFFMLKFQKMQITFDTYVTTLLHIIKKNGMGKALSEFSQVGMDRKIVILTSLCFYLFNIYQNFATCRKFYLNIYKIRSNLQHVNQFISYSINSINNINRFCGETYSNFKLFNFSIQENLIRFQHELNEINLESLSVRHLTKIGNILKSYFKLFNNKSYNDAINYGLYLDGFIDNIMSIKNNLSKKTINICKFTNKETKFKNAVFAPLINNKPISNNYNLKKNIIITGPNTSGKTTLLKTSLLNIILSQQIGMGYYKSAQINPYRYLHSYINIPDTSERDSLFQAEARRCGDIISAIYQGDTLDRHFCIFDEIFSGTNPSEAIASAYSFLKYLSRFNNFEYMLTTHYVSLCKMIDEDKIVLNKRMKIRDNKNTYKLEKGISQIKGGIKILEDLSYPPEIIENAKKIINDIII